jgi:hypothetical protein
MTELTSLWLPILLSSVIVFILSSIIHMLSPWHKSDYPQIPNENKVMDALRPFNIPPGDYMVPRASSASDMKSPEFLKKFEEGPVMIVTVRPNRKWDMATPLIQWFIFTLFIGLFVAYIASRSFSPGAHYLQVFRIVGTSAFMGYSFAYLPMSIWYGRSWSATFKMFFDGLIYALFTAGIFGWLWPS